MKNIAFIFARGGSKGLPNKNIKLLNGKPLIAYSIEQAKACSHLDEVIVSTDSKEIASVAKEYGAKVPFIRPADLAGDKSSEWDAWIHAIDSIQEEYGMDYHFVSLPATSPLRSVEDIDNGIEAFRKGKFDLVISITEADRNPYFNMVSYKNEEGEVDLVAKPEVEFTRRQDAPKVYDICTLFYITKPQYIKEHRSIFEGRVGGVEVPKNRSIDIDTIYDFKFAEMILKENL